MNEVKGAVEVLARAQARLDAINGLTEFDVLASRDRFQALFGNCNVAKSPKSTIQEHRISWIVAYRQLYVDRQKERLAEIDRRLAEIDKALMGMII